MFIIPSFSDGYMTFPLNNAQGTGFVSVADAAIRIILSRCD